MKPEDVSQEAWDDIVDDADRILSAAWRVHDENFNPHSNSISDGLWGKFVTAVARAIMTARAEEREACAKIAEDKRMAWQSAEYFGGFNDACNTVASSIRSRT